MAGRAHRFDFDTGDERPRVRGLIAAAAPARPCGGRDLVR